MINLKALVLWKKNAVNFKTESLESNIRKMNEISYKIYCAVNHSYTELLSYKLTRYYKGFIYVLQFLLIFWTSTFIQE